MRVLFFTECCDAIWYIGQTRIKDQTMDAGSSPRPRAPGQHPPGCDHIALVLQGGGALGAYQAGVYQALHEAGL